MREKWWIGKRPRAGICSRPVLPAAALPPVPVPGLACGAQNVPKHERSMDGVTALIHAGHRQLRSRHWQTLWEQNHPHWHRVQQRDWDHPVLDEWLRGLDVAMAGWPQPLVLIAHSMGCLLVAHCATSVSGGRRGAVGRPARSSGPAFPSTARGFETVPSDRLPFPQSLVVASSNDAFGSVDYAKQCAVDWGSAFVEAGAIGHINAESDLGAWPVLFSSHSCWRPRDPAILQMNAARSTDAGNPQKASVPVVRFPVEEEDGDCSHESDSSRFPP